MGSTRNKVTGAVEYVKGKVQMFVGKRTGNRSMQAKGMGHQVKGGVRYEVGKAQDAIHDLTHREADQTTSRDRSGDDDSERG
jgi:uncharacterized protein YjbJ (UPF0337 family)